MGIPQSLTHSRVEDRKRHNHTRLLDPTRMIMRPKPAYSLRTLVLGLTFVAAIVGLLSIDLSSKQLAGSPPTFHVEDEEDIVRANEMAFAVDHDHKQHHRHHDHTHDAEPAVEEDEEDNNIGEISKNVKGVEIDREEEQADGTLDEEEVSEPDAGPAEPAQAKVKRRTFGVRHGHRLAHVEARKIREGRILRTKYANPVIEDTEDQLLPFNEKFVRDKYRQTPRIEMEAEYFRFEDDFGLIDTGWSDDEVLYALQRLVDIYAQANIRIRIRKAEALARVKLSRERSMAYWFYVDYPKRNLNTIQRQERKALMDRIIGSDLINLFQALDKERQGLFDFIAGWPDERTPWENENVVGMYPSFYYFFMNGGGEGGCMRFRTGDCNTPKRIKGVEDGSLHVYCYRLDVVRRERTTEVPIVRSWERYNFTANMAIRLVAHEMGHAMTLRHPNKGCVQVSNWEMGNLMSQVMTMAGPGRTCRVTGWPEMAAKATYLTDEQIATAREAVAKDLRETRSVPGSYRVGKSTEVRAAPCRSRSPIVGFIASTVPVPEAGIITRIRWKSGRDFEPRDRLKISIGRLGPDNTWKEKRGEIVRPHTLGHFVHQEHDISLEAEESDLVAILLLKPRSDDVEGLNPEAHYYSDPDALAADVAGDIPMTKRDHPTINEVISAIDKNTIYPQVIPRAKALSHVTILTQEEGWKPAGRCAEWILNYDLDSSAMTTTF